MNFRCSELKGAIYQPQEILEIANCWVIPACKGGIVMGIPDFKLVFVCQEDVAKGNKASEEEYLFVHCYQFLFCNSSVVYWHYSTRPIIRSEPFVLSGEDISDVEKQIRGKYVQQGNTLARDFANIESFYTSFSHPVNFQEFYGKFTELFRNNGEFKGIVTLFCETINGVTILYDNVLQKIAQLQTILDALLGQPKQSYCRYCKSSRNGETWDAFLERRLREYNITDPDEIRLIIRIKKALNDARVKFIHHAKYYNPKELRNIVEDIRDDRLSDYKFDINSVLAKKNESWRTLDWDNVYRIYSVMVRNLIYFKYFDQTNFKTR